MKKPVDLAYGVNDVPPPLVTFVSGIQHVGLMAVYLLFPLIVGREAGLSTVALAHMLSLSMIVIGIANALQAIRLGPMGSGYLCPPVFTAAYLGPSVTAAQIGGMPLVWGMTLFAGAFEAGMSRFLKRLRAILPTEISGLVIFLVGFSNGMLGIRYLFMPEAGTELISSDFWIVGGLALGVMIALSVWGNSVLRTFCLLIGMVIGYWVAQMAGVGEVAASEPDAVLPVLAVPRTDHLGWSFDFAFVLPFIVGALAAILKATATIIMCQRINDAEWMRPDPVSVRRGVLADGVGTIVAGGLGATGINTSSPNVGLVAASGVASRYVAYAISGIMLVLAFVPSVTHFLTTLPRPVIGAGLIFSTCFVLASGMDIMTSRMLDTRKTLVIGCAIVAASTVELFPALYQNFPGWAVPIFSSSLVFGTCVALTLNLLFRIGVRRTESFTVRGTAFRHGDVGDFMEEQGRRWGARHDVMQRASFAVNQLVETLLEHGDIEDAIVISVSFDEFHLDIEARYVGRVIDLPDRRPSQQEIIDSDEGYRRLAGYLLRRNADRAESMLQGDQAIVRFGFDH